MLHVRNIQFKNKNLNQSLKKIYGLGNSQITKICKFLGFHKEFRNIQQYHLQKIIDYIENKIIYVEANLKKQQQKNLNFLTTVKNTRFLRNKAGLPSRGQRTKTNSKTKRKLRNG